MAFQTDEITVSGLNETLQPEGIEFRGELPAASARVLTLPAVRFVADLARHFEGTRRDLLRRRVDRQREIVDGHMPDFLAATAKVREADWKVAPIPGTSRTAPWKSPAR